MKILIIHQYYLEDYEHGGSRWNEISKFWVESGHDVTVIAGMVHANGEKKRPEYKGKFFSIKNQHNVKVIRTHVSESYNLNFFGRLWGYFSFMFSSVWAGIFYAGGGYDLVIVTSPPLFVGLSGYAISRLKRIPLIFEIRDLWPESAIDTGVLKNKVIIKLALWVEKFIYDKSQLINVLTPAFKEKLVKYKYINESKISYIPNAADFSISSEILIKYNRDELRNEFGWDGYFVVLYVGAHGVANALHQLIETAVFFKGTKVLFILIGEGMQKKSLIDLSKENNLENVIFFNPVPKHEIFKYILACDMGASVLQRNDTFKTVYSNKTFDYISCKRPILMAIDGVSRDLVEQANAGIFVEPENPLDFSNKIRFYLENRDLIEVQGENGYNYAKQNFDRSFLAKKYISELELVCLKNKRD
jgi:glycosyltransferase involved in cell wall biosynthesis